MQDPAGYNEKGMADTAGANPISKKNDSQTEIGTDNIVMFAAVPSPHAQAGESEREGRLN